MSYPITDGSSYWQYSNYTIRRKDSGRAEHSNNSKSFERDYLLSSDVLLDEATAYSYVKSWSERSDVYAIGNARISRLSVDSIENTSCKYWTIQVQWSRSVKTGGSESITLPEWTFGVLPESFSTEGGTAHITQSLSTTSYPTTPGENVISFNGNIGWNGNGFDGCDVVRPTFSFTVEKQYDEPYVVDHTSTIDWAATKLKWARLTGCVNNAAFRGFAAGEVLFMGVSGDLEFRRTGETTEQGGQLYWAMNAYLKGVFKFQCSPNNSQFNVAGLTISKPGWSYVWGHTVAVENQDGDVARDTIGVYVETVYPSASFGDLFDLVSYVPGS